MGWIDKKIQAIRHICRQLEEIDRMLADLQDTTLIQECQKERSSRLEQLKQMLE